jgi:hypothetical protein
VCSFQLHPLLTVVMSVVRPPAATPGHITPHRPPERLWTFSSRVVVNASRALVLVLSPARATALFALPDLLHRQPRSLPRMLASPTRCNASIQPCIMPAALQPCAAPHPGDSGCLSLGSRSSCPWPACSACPTWSRPPAVCVFLSPLSGHGALPPACPPLQKRLSALCCSGCRRHL